MKHDTLHSLFMGIADAIRAKKNSTDAIVADDFPAEIAGIESGGAVNIIEAENPKGTMTLRQVDKLGPVRFTVATSIEEGAFSGCQSLTSIEAPTVKNISNNAFLKCTNLTSIKLPVAIDIGDDAFWNCQSLTSIEAPVTINVGGSAFSACHSLQRVNLPEARYIDAHAFRSCQELAGIDFPKAENIGDSAFEDTKIEDVMLPKANQLGKGVFALCPYLKTLILTAAVTIPDNTCTDCESLIAVTVPLATSVGRFAFAYCKSLPVIDLPSVTSIGESAFKDCTSLSSIILRTTETVCVVDFSALNGTPMLNGQGHIYVPTVMYEYYRAGYEEAINALMPGFFDVLFRKIEDYTVDGTITGDLDESKI